MNGTASGGDKWNRGTVIRELGVSAMSAALSAAAAVGCHSLHFEFPLEDGVVRSSVNLRGVSISYEERGTGQPVILVHGFGASAFTWRDLHRGLPEGYRYLAVDLKGSGNSAKPKDNCYSPLDQAQIVIAFIDALGLQRPILVGHSFGGGVALITAMSQGCSEEHRVSALGRAALCRPTILQAR